MKGESGEQVGGELENVNRITTSKHSSLAQKSKRLKFRKQQLCSLNTNRHSKL